VKSKASGISVYSKGTGGGEAPTAKLTPIEMKLLAFMGPAIVTGDLAIEEAGFPSNEMAEVKTIKVKYC
jgi:hypothetical protein